MACIEIQMMLDDLDDLYILDDLDHLDDMDDLEDLDNIGELGDINDAKQALWVQKNEIKETSSVPPLVATDPVAVICDGVIKTNLN